MISGARQRSSDLLPLLDFLACFTCFGAAWWGYALIIRATEVSWSAGWFGLLIAAITCWFSITDFQHPQKAGLSRSLDQFFYAAGLGMVLQYGIAYLLSIQPIPLGALLAGTILSLISADLLRRWFSRMLAEGSAGILLVGYDSVAGALIPSLEAPIVGVLNEDATRVPPQLPLLGEPDQLAAAVATKEPSRIIVSGRKSCSQIPFELLLKLEYSGVAIDGAPVLYESAFCRVRWDSVRPFDLMFSEAENANPLEVAIRAIYTNLIGLLLLLVFAPVLIAVAVLVAVSGGGGAILEHTECLGLQRTPFRRLRFRTCRDDGEKTTIGRALSRCHLAGMPQIINVVRGEMALFGPPPVRKEFADRLTQMIPVYPYRFTAKPGLLGWSQAHLRRSDAVADEKMRLEYDLYYVKRASVSLDLEILLRSALKAPQPSTGAN